MSDATWDGIWDSKEQARKQKVIKEVMELIGVDRKVFGEERYLVRQKVARDMVVEEGEHIMVKYRNIYKIGDTYFEIEHERHGPEQRCVPIVKHVVKQVVTDYVEVDSE